MEGTRRTVVDDAGSSGDAALVLVAKTTARNTAAVSLPKEGREWVGGRRDCEGLYLPRAGTVVCVERADVRYAGSRWPAGCAAERRRRVGVLCWHAACVLAFLQALWRALARGQVRWDGDGACLGEAAHLFGFMMRAMLRYLRNTRGACGKAESARNLGRTALRCLTLKFQAAAGCVGRCHDAGNWDELRLGA